MRKNIQVKVESMAFRGYGVARADRRVLFIPYSVKGDEARVEIVEEKKNYSIGRIETLTRPSPLRTTPLCPYFGVCGGCQWQHIDYAMHGQLKGEVLKETLMRLGGVNQIPLTSIVPSPKPYGYRTRVQLKVEEKKLGYYEERSHRVVDIDHCPIAHPVVNQLIPMLRKNHSLLSQLEKVEINGSPEEEKVILILEPQSFSHPIETAAAELLDAYPFVKGVAIRRERGVVSYGSPFLTFSIFGKEKERPLILRASSDSFFQVNAEQNQSLIETVLAFADLKGGERVLDLYAGVGNFALPLALEAKEAWGVEENGAAVDDAVWNAERNGVTSCRFVRGKVEEVLKKWSEEKPEVIVLDPPRAGAKNTVVLISALKPKRIVYVSCDPGTLARDLGLFFQNGYRLSRVALIDMFPQTYHMEVVSLLEQVRTS